METIYTPKEVAERLKLHPETIARRIRDKSLRSYKVGREWRIKESDLMEFIERESNRG